MSSKDRLGAATLLRIAELLGAVGFLDKPIRDRQLLETVGSIVAA
jgi:FixJ family two-component response regulator